MKKGIFFSVMLVTLLVFSLVFGCDNGTSGGGGTGGGGGGPTLFDGSTLARTTWVADKTMDAETQSKLGLKKIRMTLTFSSDTAGTANAVATEWASGATQEQKSKANALLGEINGPFTSTYDSATKTGTIKLKDDSEETFTVNVDRKELTSIDEDNDVTVFKKR